MHLLPTVVSGFFLLAASASTAPAAAFVSNNANAFFFERSQLTEDLLKKLFAEQSYDLSQFSFGDGGLHTPAKRQTEKQCKTYPGDSDWPSSETWQQFSDLVGGSDVLIKTVPEASLCYHTNGTLSANATACTTLTEGWGNSTLR
jgi:hypothetical protein